MGSSGKIILSTSDNIGTILVVDYQHYRALTFDSIYEQSSYSVEKPYSVAHEYIRIMMLVVGFTSPRHITLLGLGGGSLLRSLHFYLDACRFHVIELRPKVYEVAKYYFEIPIDQRVKYSISDAKVQLKSEANASSDIIFSDLFDAHAMSPLQVQKQFVLECHRVLTPEGWLVMNFHQLPDFTSAFFVSLLEKFQSVFICPGAIGNYVLFAGKVADVDVVKARSKLKVMEIQLSTSFLPLLKRLEGFIS